jgi:GNAT superfamily N-acetyltransferase
MERDSTQPAIRLIGPDDSVAELTLLLHRAYGALAERGMRFFASHQDEDQTRKRIARGECYLAIHQTRMIGTITWRDAGQTSGKPWYDRPDVASFGQFAVEPSWQGRGIGSRLLAVAEQRAAMTGAAELALDTAEPAHDLIRFYNKRGYRFIEYVQWDVVNYRSALLSKRIVAAAQNP